MQDIPFRETALDNGIRIATQTLPGSLGVSFGLRVDAGSGDETEAENGISHLLEHMVFKGTERRTSQAIAEQMDAIGGGIDAYTTKEYTGYGFRVLPEHLPIALDVLADMLRNSLLDEKELDLEKAVILEECKSVEDSAEEYVHDVFARAVWPDHSLGRPVLGLPPVITSITRDDLLRRIATRYVPERVVIAAAGAVDHDGLVRLLERHFGDLSGESATRSFVPVETHPEEVLINRPLEQAHFCMGAPGVSETDPDRWAIRILNLILGGSMSSRLFQEIREKRGLCYSIGSDVVTYREGGLFMVYADTSPEHVAEVRALSQQELLRVAETGITESELIRAKDQVRAGTLLSLDDAGARMGRLAHSLLFHGSVIPLPELVAKVEAVTVDDCHRVAKRLFSKGQFAFAAIGPFPRRKRLSRKPTLAA